MTSDITLEYFGVKHNHTVSRQHPHLTEEIWQNISVHLSTQEWAKAAGTCKTSYTMSLKWARLGHKIPPEGRQIILSSSEACSEAHACLPARVCAQTAGHAQEFFHLMT